MTFSVPEIITLVLEKTRAGLRFLRAEFIPFRAMMLYQVRAWLPGLGEIDVLATPPIEIGLAKSGREPAPTPEW